MSDRRDPFDALAEPATAVEPDPDFVRTLRERLVVRLDSHSVHDLDTVPTLDLTRRNPMSSTTSVSARPHTSVATPYLAVRGGTAALEWYVDALGAVELMRVVGDDGRLGHAEMELDGARIMLSDAYPEIGVHSPADLAGTSVTVHLTVSDVDTRFDRAVAAGATPASPPADQPHGSRHGTLVDPYGHRWMLSQQIATVSRDEYADRLAGSGFTVEGAAESRGEAGIWAGLSYRDAIAGVRFLVDVLGFEQQSFHTDPDDPTVVTHSELRWPEGGVVQAGTYVPDNPFMQAPGAQSIYVITSSVRHLWDRCTAAGVEILRPLEEPSYHPGGLGFSIRDPEGNIVSFGDYAGGA